MAELDKKSIVIYDIETYRAIFCLVGLDISTQEIRTFTVHPELDQRVSLYLYLQNLDGGIGFNNISFDYPVLHFLMENFQYMVNQPAEEFCRIMHEKAGEIIHDSDKDFTERRFKGIKEKDMYFHQLDLYLLHHFNNSARRTSLKALQIALKLPNVMESTVPFDQEKVSLMEANEVVDYCINDVKSTYELYKVSLGKLDLRRNLNKRYNLGCFNFSDSKIGEQLMLKLYSQKVHGDPWEIRKLRTNRDVIPLKEVILPGISFRTKEFNELLKFFSTQILVETKGLDKSVIYKNFKYDCGAGGIHGCIKSGIYESTDRYIIKSCDVASLYPSIAVQNGFYPEHLGPEFCDVYSDILKQRLEAKKSGDMVMSDGFKLSANSVYGKSNDKYSFLYDPKFTMSITINGQLLLGMLAEQLAQIPDSQVLMINTDGIEIMIPRDHIDIYNEICEDWQIETSLKLEFVDYKKMIIRDVNNYISQSTAGKIKRKGFYEHQKELHQDNSFMIVPKALEAFFLHGTPVETFIKTHTDIYDFCGRQKFKGQDYGETHQLAYDEKGVPYNKVIRQQKNTRYYMSTPGCTFIKQYKKGTWAFIHKDQQITVFNKYRKKPMQEYNLDYNFYIREAYKEINQIIDKQLNLF